MSNTYAEGRERALRLARTGNYEDWHAVCRKMLYDGWGIEIFNEAAFTAEIDTLCARGERLSS
jgi:hypothetical protein